MDIKPSPARKEIMDCLSRVYEAEMSGITRYLHYSFMIMGHNRIPIQKWFRDQATESMGHAVAIGEKITSYGGHPPIITAEVKETEEHSVRALLEDSLSFETEGLQLYKELARLAGTIGDGDIALEELARSMVRAETEHLDEVRKMLRNS